MNKQELRFTGSGGQGVILGTIIMAEAAFLDGKQVVQSQSYGPEARGGLCKAETIVSDERINYTKIEKPTFLLSMTQESFNKFSKKNAPGAIILVDDSIEVPPRFAAGHNVYKLPIISSAINVLHQKVSANIIACGAVNEALHLASDSSLEEAVLNHVPKGTEELNRKAMRLGIQMVQEIRAAREAATDQIMAAEAEAEAKILAAEATAPADSEADSPTPDVPTQDVPTQDVASEK